MMSEIERKKPCITDFGPCHTEIQEIEVLRQQVKELENNLKTARAVGEYRHELIIKLDSELAALKGQGNTPCEPINPKNELDALKGITAFNHNNAASNVQSGILKQSQSELVAYIHKWKLHAATMGKSLSFRDRSPHGDDMEIIPLYTSAPAIPEGWQLVPIEPTSEMILAAVKGQSNRTTVPRDDELAAGMYYDMLAAAPKLGDKE